MKEGKEGSSGRKKPILNWRRRGPIILPGGGGMKFVPFEKEKKKGGIIVKLLAETYVFFSPLKGKGLKTTEGEESQFSRKRRGRKSR